MNDLTTAVIGIITLGFIALGLDHLLFLLNTMTERGEVEKADISAGPARIGAHYRLSSDPLFKSPPAVGVLRMEGPASSSYEVAYSSESVVPPPALLTSGSASSPFDMAISTDLPAIPERLEMDG